MALTEHRRKALSSMAKGIDLNTISENLNISVPELQRLAKKYHSLIKDIELSIKLREMRINGEYEEVLRICNLPKYARNDLIQAQKVTVLTEQFKAQRSTDIDTALAICNQKCFRSSLAIQACKVSILIMLYQKGKIPSLKEAEEICKNPNFSQNEMMINLQKAISKAYRYPLRPKKPAKVSPTDNGFYYPILNMIRNHEATLEQISSLNGSPWVSSILTLAFYESEKYPPNVITRYINSILPTYQRYPEAIRLLELIKKRSQVKNKIFDIGYYQIFLYYRFDLNEERAALIELQNALQTKTPDDNLKL